MELRELAHNRHPADISIYTKEGMVFKEKGVLAISEKGKILAVGDEAEEIVKNPYIKSVLVSPFYQGRVFDYASAVKLLQHLLKKCNCNKRRYKKRMVIMIPEESNDIERVAVKDLMYQLGAKNSLIIDDKKEYREKIPFIFENLLLQNHKIELLITIGNDNPLIYAKEMAQDLSHYMERYELDKEEILKIFQ